MKKSKVYRDIADYINEKTANKLLKQILLDIEVVSLDGGKSVDFPTCSKEVHKIVKKRLKKYGFSVKCKKTRLSYLGYSIYEETIRWWDKKNE